MAARSDSPPAKTVEPSATVPRPLINFPARGTELIETGEQFDLRPEFAARARVYYELLTDLGASVEIPPEDGEKQRKAARVGAKRRLAVIARNDPDLMLDDLAIEADKLLAELFELGPLTELVGDPSVREIVIRDPHRIYVDRGSGRERHEGGFSCADSLALALRRFLGAPIRWDASAPWLDHRMPDGTRVRGADSSVAPGGPIAVISRPGPVGTGGLSQVASISDPIAEYLRAVLRARGSVLLCVGQGCDGTALASACAHELGTIDPGHLAIVRAGSRLVAPHDAMVFEAEPGLTAAAIRLAVDTGSTALVVHRAGGAGLASTWSGLGRGLVQAVVSIAADNPEAALEVCVEGLLLGGYGRDREALRRHVAASIHAVVALGVNARGEEVPVALAEFLHPSAEGGGQGWVVPVLSRATADAAWHHHRAPAFVAEMARRGVPFDPAKLAALARS